MTDEKPQETNQAPQAQMTLTAEAEHPATVAVQPQAPAGTETASPVDRRSDALASSGRAMGASPVDQRSDGASYQGVQVTLQFFADGAAVIVGKVDRTADPIMGRVGGAAPDEVWAGTKGLIAQAQARWVTNPRAESYKPPKLPPAQKPAARAKTDAEGQRHPRTEIEMAGMPLKDDLAAIIQGAKFPHLTAAQEKAMAENRATYKQTKPELLAQLREAAVDQLKRDAKSDQDKDKWEGALLAAQVQAIDEELAGRAKAQTAPLDQPEAQPKPTEEVKPSEASKPEPVSSTASAATPNATTPPTPAASTPEAVSPAPAVPAPAASPTAPAVAAPAPASAPPSGSGSRAEAEASGAGAPMGPEAAHLALPAEEQAIVDGSVEFYRGLPLAGLEKALADFKALAAKPEGKPIHRAQIAAIEAEISRRKAGGIPDPALPPIETIPTGAQMALGDDDRAPGFYVKATGAGPFKDIQAAFDAMGLPSEDRPRHNRYSRLSKKYQDMLTPVGVKS